MTDRGRKPEPEVKPTTRSEPRPPTEPAEASKKETAKRQPPEPDDDRVDEASQESFPASDAPAY